MKHFLFLLLFTILSCPVFSQEEQFEVSDLEFHSPGPEFNSDTANGLFVHKEEKLVTTWGPRNSYKATIKITRYYGTSSEREQQVRIGVLPKYANLIIPAGDCDYQCPPYFFFAPQVDLVYLNGHYLGSLTGTDNEWVLNNFQIPIEHVNFPSSPSGIGENHLEIIVDSANKFPCWYLDQYCQAIEIPAPLPILLVHGWTPNGSSAMHKMRDIIREIWGIPCELASAPMDNSPDDNGILLESQLCLFCDMYGVEKFNIVAHSKGGLDSRALIDQHHVNSSHAEQLLQISTPNAGSYLADMLITPNNLLAYIARKLPTYHNITQGMLSLTSYVCNRFNLTHNTPNAPIRTIIGRVRNFMPFDGHDDNGDGYDYDGFWDYYVLGKYSYNHDYYSANPDQQGDGIVSVSSAHALGTQLSASPLEARDTRYAHDKIILDPGGRGVLEQFAPYLCKNSFNNDSHEQDIELRALQYLNQLGETIAEETIVDSSGTVMSTPMESARDNTTDSELKTYNILTKSATLEAGQTADIRFDLPAPSSETSFLVLRIPPEAEVHLLLPDGTAKPVTATAGEDEDGLVAYLGAREIEAGATTAGCHAIRVTNPLEEAIAITVACRHVGVPTALELQQEGNRVTISYLRDGTVVCQSGLPLQCKIIPADMELADDHAAPMEIPLEYKGDGRYGAAIPAVPEGDYFICATWQDSLGETALYQTVPYFHSAVQGSLLPPDEAGTKLYAGNVGNQEPFAQAPSRLATALRFTLHGIVEQPGRYAVMGRLVCSDGHTIATTSQHQVANSAGELTFLLDFNGHQIYDSQCDGLYSLQDCRLFYLGENGSPKELDRLAAWSSGPYRHTDFIHPPFALAGIESEWLEELTLDEWETQTLLHINFRIQVAPGYEDFHAFGATLYTPDRQNIRSFIATEIDCESDETGSSILAEVIIDTRELLESGSYGPYVLENFYAIDNQRRQYILFQGKAFTESYQEGQFSRHASFNFLSIPAADITITPVEGEENLFHVALHYTREENSANQALQAPGVPVMPPYGIAMADLDNQEEKHLAGSSSVFIYATEFEILDLTEEVIRQLKMQGNRDEYLDIGETIQLEFQCRLGNEVPLSSVPFYLRCDMLQPFGTPSISRLTPHCLSTDVDQDFRISAEEADNSRQLWTTGEISHHLFLQTLEFSKHDGYHYDATRRDFMPGRE